MRPLSTPVAMLLKVFLAISLPCLPSAATAAMSAPQTATQVLDEGLVPAGLLRLRVLPTFTAWDSRYGMRIEDGATVQEEEPLARELIHERGAIFPGFTELEEHVRAMLGDPSFMGMAGIADATVKQDFTRVDLGAHVGVFDWLTVGVAVPLVKGRLALETILATDAAGTNLGTNPASRGNSGVNRFLDQLERASSEATGWAAGVCAGDPASRVCSDAQALSGRLADFERAARGAYASALVFPMAGTAVADSLGAAVARLAGELNAQGLGGIDAPMVFATEWFTAEAFSELPGGSDIGGRPLAPIDGVWKLGDVELAVLGQVLSGAVQDSGAAVPRFSYRVTAGFTTRLGTGTPEAQNILFDVGTGDGQIDFEGRLTGIFGVGRYLGLRLGARYGIQRPVTLERRVAPPEWLLAPLSRVRSVTWTPAPYLGIDAEPALTLTDDLSVFASYRWFNKGTDDYALLGEDVGADTGVDPADLELESVTRPWVRREPTTLPR